MHLKEDVHNDVFVPGLYIKARIKFCAQFGSCFIFCLLFSFKFAGIWNWICSVLFCFALMCIELAKNLNRKVDSFVSVYECARVFMQFTTVIMVEQYIALLISGKLFVTLFLSISTEFYVHASLFACQSLVLTPTLLPTRVCVRVCLMQISRMHHAIVLTMLSFHEIGQNTIAISIQVNRYPFHWNVLLYIARELTHTHSHLDDMCKVCCACFMDAKWMLSKNETTECDAMQCRVWVCRWMNLVSQ